MLTHHEKCSLWKAVIRLKIRLVTSFINSNNKFSLQEQRAPLAETSL